jgi:hypothetical protein
MSELLSNGLAQPDSNVTQHIRKELRLLESGTH